MLKALCILILPGLLAGSSQAAERRLILEKVDVTGSTRLPSAFLERELHLTQGAEVTEGELTADRDRILGTGLFQSVQFFLSKGENPGRARLKIELVDDPGVFGAWAWGGSLGLTQDQSSSEQLAGEFNPLSVRAQLISRNLFNALHRASGAVDYDGQGIMRGFHVAYGFPRFSEESVQFDARMEAADAQVRYLDILGFGSRGQAYWTFDQESGARVQYGLAIYMNNRGQRFSLPGFPLTLMGPKIGVHQENRLLSFRPSEGYAYGASVVLSSQGFNRMGYEVEAAVTESLFGRSMVTAQVQGLSVGLESLSYRGSLRWEQPLPILDEASDPGIYFQFTAGADHYKDFRYQGREARLGLRFHSAGLIADVAVAYRALPESMKEVLQQEWGTMIKYLVLVLLLGSRQAWADIRASWEQGKERYSLRISLAHSLTEQQKKLLYSGFSTFSHLEVRWLDNNVRRSLVFISECTIKFDLWEEKFELLHFLERRKDNSLQSFQQYTDLCLQADISSQSNIAQIASQGARLEVRLDISQVSSEFAQDVRSWLIQQQSGVMRGLFSHMLGDLKLSESTQTVVIVAPLATEPEKSKPVTKGAGRG